MDLSLVRIEKVLHELGNPQLKLKVAHVAGTNGKGSVCSFIETILLETGLKVAKFNSPHFLNIYDSILVDKEPIARRKFDELKGKIAELSGKLDVKLTNFELMTTIAFLHFDICKVDVVVLEVGLGGRNDATNVILESLVSIITPIALDHVQLLGNSLSEIAYHKAGIIKRGGRVVISCMDEEPTQTIVSECERVEAKYCIAGTAQELEFDATHLIRRVEYTSRSGSCYRLQLQLLGQFQLVNLAASLEAIEVIQSYFPITALEISRGVAKATWNGRLQFVKLINGEIALVDGAHNLAATKQLKRFIDTYIGLKYKSQSLTVNWIYAATQGKDVADQFVELFTNKSFINDVQLHHKIYLTQFSLPDMMPWIQPTQTQQLSQLLLNLKNVGKIQFENVEEFLDVQAALLALNCADPSESLTVVTGSLYLVADLFREFVS